MLTAMLKVEISELLCDDKFFSVPDMPSPPATSTTRMEELQRIALWNVVVPKYSCTTGNPLYGRGSCRQ